MGIWARVLEGRTEQSGMLVAAAAVPTTFQRTLMPRSTTDQAVVTGLSLAATYGLTVLVQEVIEDVARTLIGDDESRRAAIAVDLAALGAGLALQQSFRQHPKERVAHAAARTGGYWLSTPAFAGALVAALHEAFPEARPGRRRVPLVLPAAGIVAGLVEWRRRRLARGDAEAGVYDDDSVQRSVAQSFALGLGVTAGVAALAAVERVAATALGGLIGRMSGVHSRHWRAAGHALTMAAFAAGMRLAVERVYDRIEHTAESVEEAYPIAPDLEEVSGGPGSDVRWSTLSRAGRRFVSTVLTGAQIESVMGEAARQPVRVFVGLESADSEDGRVALALEELDRTGAFDRELLVLASPTGTGYVNYVFTEAVEYLTRGNCATAAIQYSMRPSPLSLDRVWQGRHHLRALVRGVHERLAERPAEQRPKVVLFGESLGAHTSQDAFLHRGTRGFLDEGVDAAIWIGTPYASEWKRQVLADDHAAEVDPSLVAVCNDIGEYESLPGRDGAKYVMVTHHNDAVALFGLDLLVQAPSWLDHDRSKRPPGVPKSERWVTPITFLHTLIDMKNAANVVPGQFEAKGHDYRADLLPFVRAVYRLEATDEQCDRIEAALRRAEEERKEWAEAHKPAEHELTDGA